jgi:hypothetical protein
MMLFGIQKLDFLGSLTFFGTKSDCRVRPRFFDQVGHKTMYASTLQMFAGIYRDFGGISECRDFKFTGIPCIPAIPVIFEVNQKKVWTFYIYSLLRFFKFPYNFCRDFRRTCNPCDNYMHFTGYVLRHRDPPHFLWGKNLQCRGNKHFLNFTCFS